MSFAYVQPIFCPTHDMLGRNIVSVNSFYDYYDKMGYTFECIFGGYCANDELWDEISELIIKRSKGRVFPIRYDKNYGKAYIVNSLSEGLSDNVKYMLTADSDIIFKIDQLDIKDRLIEAFEYANSISLNPSLIALFQEEGNCHILELCYENKYYYQGKLDYEMICKPSISGGVAGGCLCISKEFWDKVGGYQVLGVYAADDANLMQDSFNMGYSFMLSNSIRCIHPNETNAEYQNWKISVCPNSSDIDSAIIVADEFWNSK